MSLPIRINTILDPIFIFAFHMGIAGATWATVISQTIAGIMTLAYLHGFHTTKLLHQHLLPIGRQGKMV